VSVVDPAIAQLGSLQSWSKKMTVLLVSRNEHIGGEY
jgi:hypothetical protein